MELLFWLFVGITIYVYFGYPLLLIIVAKISNQSVRRANITPSVTMIIAAHNEEKSIHRKLQNSLNLDYPKDKLEIIVASDGSTDKTNVIVGKFKDQRIRLVYDPIQKGKSSIQKKAVENANGDVIVFTDAPTLLDSNALSKIVRPFYDKTVGCIMGKAKNIDISETSVSEANNLYNLYEEFLQKKESQIGSLAMGSGWLFATRKNLIEPLDINVGDDFVIPLGVVEKGFKVIYERKAISYDRGHIETKAMFRAKYRVVTKDLRGLFSKKVLLNPIRFPLVSWSLISHKLLRWLIPYFLIVVLISNCFLLNIIFYQITFALEVTFLLLSLVGWILQNKGIKVKVFYIPFYYCLVNLAALIGVAASFLGKKMGHWTPDRYTYYG